MKKTKSKNLQLFLIFLAIVSFLIFLAFRNEKKYTPVPEEKVNIKTPYEVKSPIINNEEGKG